MSFLSYGDFLLLQRVCFGQQYSRGCAKLTDTNVLPHLARIGGSDARVSGHHTSRRRRTIPRDTPRWTAGGRRVVFEIPVQQDEALEN